MPLEGTRNGLRAFMMPGRPKCAHVFPRKRKALAALLFNNLPGLTRLPFHGLVRT
jgi:hypothetical protein